MTSASSPAYLTIARFSGDPDQLLADYRKYFDASDAPRPSGIAVLTDADDTRSQAQGDYARFRACTEY